MNGPISALSRMQLNFLANFQLRLSVFHKTRPILVGSSADRSLNEPAELSHENWMALEQTILGAIVVKNRLLWFGFALGDNNLYLFLVINIRFWCQYIR